MKVKNLIIENFMAVGSTSIALDDKGLLLIQGENRDDTSQISNGAGKSTIAEALCWALYGETARGDTGDAVVNKTAGKGTAVVVELSDERGDCYRISRYRKHKTYKNSLRCELFNGLIGEYDDHTKGTDKLTQELVNKVLGCDYEVFAAAIYAGQEKMADLPSMTDKQLKVLVEEAAGISQLQNALDVAKKRLATATDEMRVIGGKVSSFNARMDAAKDNLEQLEQRVGEFNDGQEVKIRDLRMELADKERLFDSTKKASLMDMVAKVDTKIGSLQTQLDAVEVERTDLKRLQDSARSAEHAFIKLNAELTSATKEALKFKHALEHIADKVGEECKSCGHVIEESDLAGSKAAIKTQAVDAAAVARKLKQDTDDAHKRYEHACSDVAAHEARMTDVSAVAATLRDLNDKKATIQAAIRGENEKAAYIDSLKAKIDAECKRPNPFREMLQKQKDAIDTMEGELIELAAERDKAQAKVDLCQEAVRVFGPAGVRAHILDTVTPFLNIRTAHYLSALTDGNIEATWSTISTTAKGELREKFVIEVKSKTGAESFKGLSGGEKRKVRLACAMALQDLVSSRATKPFKLFIADEIDHALDSSGLERLMVILDEKSRDKGTVLVISHTDLRDFIRNTITVVKEKGVSRIEAA